MEFKAQNNTPCFLCYNPVPGFIKTRRSLKSRNFLTLLARYLKINRTISKEISKTVFVLCVDCYHLGKTFNNLYFQLDSIKLLLNWKVSRIFETMVHSEKVPIKSQFQKRISMKAYKHSQTLRTEIIKFCKRKLQLSQPRVVLKQLEAVHDDGNQVTVVKSEADNSLKEPLTTKFLSLLAVLNLSDLVSFPFPTVYENVKIAFSILPEVCKKSNDDDGDESQSLHNILSYHTSMETDRNEKEEQEMQAIFQPQQDPVPLVSHSPPKLEVESIEDDLSIPSNDWIPVTQCEQCGASFSIEAEVEKHRVIAHKLVDYVRCPLCFQMFSGFSSYLKHRSTKPQKSSSQNCYTADYNSLVPAAAPSYPYPNHGLISTVGGHHFCPHEGCTEVFHLESKLQLHLSTHGKWNCFWCPQIFPKAHDLAWHEIKVHYNNNVNKASESESSLQIRCSRCKVVCKGSQGHELISHFLYKHLDIPGSSLESRSSLSSSSSSFSNCEGLKCPICKLVWPSSSSRMQLMLQNHIRNWHDVEHMDPADVAICGVCQAPFTSQFLLDGHMKLVHELHTMSNLI